MSEAAEYARLITLAQSFLEAVQSRADSATLKRAFTGWENDELQQRLTDSDKIDQDIERLEKSGPAAELDRRREDMGRNALRIADLFAGAAQRVLGAGDAFIFLPAEARNTETAVSFASHGAPALAGLCRRSLE